MEIRHEILSKPEISFSLFIICLSFYLYILVTISSVEHDLKTHSSHFCGVSIEFPFSASQGAVVR